jgi:hypothetical protein
VKPYTGVREIHFIHGQTQVERPKEKGKHRSIEHSVVPNVVLCNVGCQ